MEITTRKVNDVLVVDMTGRLVTQTSGYASDEMVQIAKSGNSKIVLNLDNLEFISSAGLSVILRAAKLLQTSGGALKICRANSLVNKVMETSGFKSLLTMYDSENDALAAFSS